MLVQITIQIEGREVRLNKTLQGTPAEREEAGHAVAREVGRLISEATLNEAARNTQPIMR